MEQRQGPRREEHAIILDFLQHGYPFDTRPSHLKSSIAQSIGKTRFALLELIPKEGVFLQPNQEVYVGDGPRDKIHHVVGKIPLEKLTGTAKQELEHAINRLIQENEQRFVEFFNTARPMSVRTHQLELLPGIGKKHMSEIIERREEKPFTSFQDIRERVKLMPDPVKLIRQRIENELLGEEKHRIFVDV